MPPRKVAKKIEKYNAMYIDGKNVAGSNESSTNRVKKRKSTHQSKVDKRVKFSDKAFDEKGNMKKVLTQDEIQKAAERKKECEQRRQEKADKVLENKSKRKHKKKMRKNSKQENLLMTKFNYNFFKHTATAFMIEEWLQKENEGNPLPDLMMKHIETLKFIYKAEPWRQVGIVVLKERYPGLIPKDVNGANDDEPGADKNKKDDDNKNEDDNDDKIDNNRRG